MRCSLDRTSADRTLKLFRDKNQIGEKLIESVYAAELGKLFRGERIGSCRVWIKYASILQYSYALCVVSIVHIFDEKLYSLLNSHVVAIISAKLRCGLFDMSPCRWCVQILEATVSWTYSWWCYAFA